MTERQRWGVTTNHFKQTRKSLINQSKFKLTLGMSLIDQRKLRKYQFLFNTTKNHDPPKTRLKIYQFTFKTLGKAHIRQTYLTSYRFKFKISRKSLIRQSELGKTTGWKLKIPKKNYHFKGIYIIFLILKNKHL